MKNKGADKVRLDVLLVNRGLFPSREQARGAIMAGEVMVGEQKIDKAGTMVAADAPLRLLGERLPFVSRGGLKLDKALDCFAIDLGQKTVLDIGASTGGFTDCALQHGAAKVYAVDVGYNQLAWSLRNDPRVVVLEKTNARYLQRETIGEDVDFICSDVSFISLLLVLPPAVEQLLKPGGRVAALIKPQFEAGRENVGKKGVVRDKQVHKQVILKIIEGFRSMGLTVQGLNYSPVTGADGNIEYLICGCKGGGEAPPPDVDAVIEEAWAAHGK
ncbi:MAG: TlyA family RNA methyltransferase [Firmicutes bacterium]|nr:TlyA family RNA methyltransferase [Bacillota bacterium]